MYAEGISCIATPSRSDFKKIREKVAVHLRRGGRVARLPHSNQLWMLVGFALFQELSKLAECIEVFPQAIVRAIGAEIFISPSEKDSKYRSLLRLVHRMARRGPTRIAP